jgi:hypothetical protein
MTARPFVELTIPPYGGELDSWGKDSRGQWWGLVTWYEDVILPRQMGRSSVLPCSGWVAARHLRKRVNEDRAHHVGTLTERPYELPEGYAARGVSPA